MKVLVINGPNLNMLGIREKHIYGTETYADLKNMIHDYCQKEGIEVDIFQSNHEGALVDHIQTAYFNETDAIVINPAAYTHTSVAILDALKAVNLPAVEVHLSDVGSREEAKHNGTQYEQRISGVYRSTGIFKRKISEITITYYKR